MWVELECLVVSLWAGWCSSVFIVLTFVTLHLTSRCCELQLSDNTKYLTFSLEIFSVKKYSLLAILYLSDVNVLKFQTYLVQFNLIKPNCPLKCRYEKRTWSRWSGSDLQIASLCPTNLENKTFYFQTFFNRPESFSVAVELFECWVLYVWMIFFEHLH